MHMWWYYQGTVELDDGTEIEVKSKYTIEEALEAFADWPSGSPKYTETIELKEKKSRFEKLRSLNKTQ